MIQKILGVDPAVNRVGYGLIEIRDKAVSVLSTGVISSIASASYQQKVINLIEKFDKILDKFLPDMVVIEEIYVGKNARIALKIGQITGLLIASSIRRNVPFHLISPAEVKESLTGSGIATKQQVQFMLEHITGYRNFKNMDESDAVAVAVAYIQHKKEYDLLYSG
ncbi:MAG: crossover junction endodeoxyribonuclease RuvC [Candidatus Omnitrophica bacterium]|nr:crossover junction endodeoxyribonuclease RuvC [Candidatus Omnitrophota bacterium]MCM8777675.1 crossover junction endodeoxyribonuclease RuvC [Candidatus Omnitrophota bacterium]